MHINDTEAINKLKRGDITGLEALVNRYQLLALRAAYAVTGDKAMAEDVVQDAFLRVYERAKQFDGKRPFGPWFLRIVVNNALNNIRKSDRHVSLENSLDKKGVPVQDTMADLRPNMHELMEKAELQKAIWEAIKKLPPSQRAAVVLKYYLGLTDKQIAERQDIHPGTVKRLLHRARGRLRLLLDSTIIKLIT